MTKKFLLGLTTLVLGSTLTVGGVAIAGYAAQNADPVDPSATTDYTMTIDATNPLVFDSTDTSVATAKASETSGLSIGFKTANAASADGSAFKFTTIGNYSATAAKIYNTDPIHGIKKIKVTFGANDGTDYMDRPHYIRLSYGYEQCAFTRAIDVDDSNMRWEYSVQSEGWGIGYDSSKVYSYEFSFIEEIAPNYFALSLDQGNTIYNDAKNQVVTSIEITYNCAPTVNESVESVTVSNLLELNQAMLYYRNIAPTLGGTIKIGSSFMIDRPVYARARSNSLTVTLDLNGQTLTAQEGSNFYKTWGTWEDHLHTGLFRGHTLNNATVTFNVIDSVGGGTMDTNGLAMELFCPGSYSSESVTVNIKGGTYLATANRPALIAYSSHNTTTMTYNVTGGTFRHRDGSSSERLLYVGDNNTNTFHVTGGSFEGFNPANFLGESTEGIVKSVPTTDETTGLTTYNVSISTDALPTTMDSPASYSLNSDITLTSTLTVSADVTILGNGHTIKVESDIKALDQSIGSTLNIKNVTFDLSGIKTNHGLVSRGVMNLDTVTVSNYSADAINAYKIPVYFYGSGVTGGSLTNCTIDSNVTTYNDPSYAEVWLGALRDITVSGGQYGKIFVNAYENTTSKSFNCASLTLEGNATVDNLVVETEDNAKSWIGTKESVESTYAVGSIIYHANLKVADGCTVTNLNTNPDSIEGVTVTGDTASETGYTVYGWSVGEGLTLAEELTNLSPVA